MGFTVVLIHENSQQWDGDGTKRVPLGAKLEFLGTLAALTRRNKLF